MVTTERLTAQPQISVIVPARNEEACLAECLHSLVTQTGVAFEIILVDDHSTDQTREIGSSFPEVRIIEAGPLPEGWTGKNNAVTAGVREAHGEWLLFTDADTVHLPGSLARALMEAQENKADFLSYSPEQIAVTFWEMATLPVIFAELATQYPASVVSDPASPVAAANGQFILVRREAYDAVGGHVAVASDILEDVALARAVKRSGRKIRFRYASEAVRTRMYRNYRELRDGWSKNLALLFPNAGWLAAKSLLLWALPWALLFLPLVSLLGVAFTGRFAALIPLNGKFLMLSGFARHWWWILISSLGLQRNLGRLRRANFDLAMEWLGALFGMPMFAYLLLRSKRAHAKGKVLWKGRIYDSENPLPTILPTDAKPPKTTLMKLAVILIVPTVLLLESGSRASLPPSAEVRSDAAIVSQSSEPTALSSQTVIEPGSRVGPLKLGDTRERALELFPKKDEDQEWQNHCGTTLDWVDAANRTGHGDVWIRLKKGKVFQIETSTTRFHTSEGITTFDPPEKIANHYKDLKAFTLLTPPVPALGDRPLVFWVDKKNGITFVFAYYPAQHKRYLYKIIVFEPNRDFCPEEETVKSSTWQEIPAYSLEPPIELAPNGN